MRVLMTGFTSLQRGPERRGDIRKIDVPGTIAEKLREAGHQVDWRPVALGEDLDGYDAAWVNLARPISMNSRVGAYGAMWTLSQGVPCVGFYDDWQSPITVQNDFRIMQRRPNFVQKYIVDSKALRKAAGIDKATHLDRGPAMATVEAGREVLRSLGYGQRDVDALHAYRFYDEPGLSEPETYEVVERHKGRLNLLIDAMADGARWAAGMVPVCPMFSWGDHEIVQRLLPQGSLPLVPLDPSEIAWRLTEQWTLDGNRLPKRKKREWLLSALMPHDGWLSRQTFRWPVWNTGSRTLIKRLGRGERLATESDVITAHAARWGVLSPPYVEHAGSGWWRSRFIYAAAAGCVLVADQSEVSCLDPSYSTLTFAKVERMTNAELGLLSEAQADALIQYAPGEGDILAAATLALRRAMGTDRGLGG